MSKTSLSFRIITTERVVYERDALQVTLPTKAGEITILAGHIPLISVMGTGAITVTDTENMRHVLAVSGGILEVRKSGEVVVLAKRSEHADDIDIDRAQAAYDRAKAYLDEKRGQADADYARFQAMLEKNLNRVQIANLHRVNRS